MADVSEHLERTQSKYARRYNSHERGGLCDGIRSHGYYRNLFDLSQRRQWGKCRGVAIDPVPTASCPKGPNPGVCIYVTGETFSKDFPNKNAYLPGPLATDPVAGTIYLTKINPAGSGASSLVYSSFLGGQNGDFGNSVAVDTTGNAYITGITLSPAGAATSGDFLFAADFRQRMAMLQTATRSLSGSIRLNLAILR